MIKGSIHRENIIIVNTHNIGGFIYKANMMLIIIKYT